MATTVDELQINIKANSDKANTSLENLCNTLSKLSGLLGGVDASKFTALANATQGVADGLKGINASAIRKVEALKEAMSSTSSASNGMANATTNINAAGVAAGNATKKINDLNSSAKSLNADSFKSLAQYITEARDKIDLTASSITELREKLSNINIDFKSDSLDYINSKLNEVKAKAEELRQAMGKKAANGDYVDDEQVEKDKAELDGLINAIERLMQRKLELESHGGFDIKINGLSNILSNFKKVNKAFISFIAYMSGAKAMMHGLSKASNKFSLSNNNLAKSLTRTTKMLALMIKRMILRKLITNVTDGFKNLAQGVQSFNTDISLLWNSFRQLGNSVAAAVSPLINALAPALNYIIQLCIKAVNAINQLISALTGHATWTKAKTLSDDYGKSLDKSNKSANKLKKTVLGFDELNQMKDKDSGGGTTDPTDMFETEQVEAKWKNFSDKLKKMWEDSDFTELGTILGTKLRDALQKIPWDSIRRTANNIGKDIATFINGGVEVVNLGKTIGSTLAQSINTAFEFINGFVKNLHWANVGKFIADTFNGFFETIDWTLIRETVVTGFTGLARSINSFISNFNWDNISNTLSNALNTIIEAVKKFFGDVKWGDLGLKLGEQLTETFKKIEWEDMGEAIANVVNAALDFAFNFLKGLEFTEVLNSIKELLKGFFEGVDKEELAVAIAGILTIVLGMSAAKTIGSAIVTSAGTKIMKAMFGESGLVTTMATELETMFGDIFASVKTSKFAGQLGILATQIGVVITSAIAASVTIDAILDSGAFRTWAEDLGYSKDQMQEFADKYDGLTGKIKLFMDGFNMMRMAFADLPDNITYAIDATDAYNAAIRDAKQGIKLTNEQLDLMQKAYGLTNEQINTIKSTMTDATEKTRVFADKIKVLTDKGYSLDTAIGIVEKDMGTWTSTESKLAHELKDGTAKLEDYTTKTINADTETGKVTTSTQKFGGELETTSGKAKDFSDKMDDANDKLGTYKSVSSDVESITGKIGSSFEKAGEKIKDLRDKLGDLIDKIKSNSNIGMNVGINASSSVGGFATGGFPEDGWFRASHGEMLGSFDNGQSVVANNMQIIEGISEGVADGMMQVMMANSGSSNSGTTHIHVQFGNEELGVATYKAMKQAGRMGLIPRMV